MFHVFLHNGFFLKPFLLETEGWAEVILLTGSVSIADGTCVSECGDGFFADVVSRECEPCHRSCVTCVGYSYKNCTGCKNSFQLSHGQCLNPGNSLPVRKLWSGKLKQVL